MSKDLPIETLHLISVQIAFSDDPATLVSAVNWFPYTVLCIDCELLGDSTTTADSTGSTVRFGRGFSNQRGLLVPVPQLNSSVYLPQPLSVEPRNKILPAYLRFYFHRMDGVAWNATSAHANLTTTQLVLTFEYTHPPVRKSINMYGPVGGPTGGLSTMQ